MKITLLLAIALAAACGAASAADLRQPMTAAGALATERLWVAALEGRDKATLGQLLADDFVDTTWQGEARGRQAAIDVLDRPRTAAIGLTDLSASLYGDVAVVRGLNTLRTSDGAIVGRVRFTDVFVYRRDRWQAVSAQESVVGKPG